MERLLGEGGGLGRGGDGGGRGFRDQSNTAQDARNLHPYQFTNEYEAPGGERGEVRLREARQISAIIRVGCGLVAEHLPSMHEVLGSSPRTTKVKEGEKGIIRRKRKKERGMEENKEKEKHPGTWVQTGDIFRLLNVLGNVGLATVNARCVHVPLGVKRKMPEFHTSSLSRAEKSKIRKPSCG